MKNPSDIRWFFSYKESPVVLVDHVSSHAVEKAANLVDYCISFIREGELVLPCRCRTGVNKELGLGVRGE